ncbi:hypothetical protein RD792_001139 [Penstemon davidsonii]|uniref:Rab escort protein 1 n=1 Tax=Penstemon davidsonii TaxID=160366 RepID=A0ABR0DMV2_9LAMI|nr:hypothetical protein RD792_001139 [Penstemon davidsonii]
MDETASYPPIEPSNFDLIVIGTGLPESILASAASATGKNVLHLDPNPFYGTLYSSLPLNELTSFLRSQSQPLTPENDESTPQLLTLPLYSSIEINSLSLEPIENSRKLNLDLSGPRVLLCSDSMIDLILKTGINQYMEFKSVDASFVGDAEGNLGSVPDSRSAIFKDRSLSLTEKNQLMKLFKLVQGHIGKESGEDDLISEEDLESPFVEFLNKFGLSQKLKSIILYAIVLADHDQDNLENCKDVINTKSGIDHLALYHSSIGRFPNANGPMIYPIYGQGELPQAFCRRAAVKGCIYKNGLDSFNETFETPFGLGLDVRFVVFKKLRCDLGWVLRMPVAALLMDKDGLTYKGVKLVSGQELFSNQLILAPCFMIPSRLTPAAQVANSYDVGRRDAKEKVARGICIAKSSVKPEAANCLVFFPPKSLYPEQKTTVRVLQLSGNVAACPSGMFVTYLSAMCDNAVEGKKLLDAAISALFSLPICGNSENNGIEKLSEHTDSKPILLWSALYIQELTMFQDSFNSISFTPLPDEHLHYNYLLDATEKLYQKIYPNEEFLTQTNLPEEPVDDDSSELD